MKHARLDLARGANLLPELDGPVGVFGAIEVDRLRGLEGMDLHCESGSFVTSSALKSAGFEVTQQLGCKASNAIVFLPRAKAEALHLIARAVAAAPEGWIIVDGQKTDAIESIAKQIARDVPIAGSYSKGHGKTIWFEAAKATSFCKWQAQPQTIEDGFVTAPGVFSADGIDPASALLVEHLPKDLSGRVVDLGAGWGYISSQLLGQARAVKTLHLVEDNAAALDCAKRNVADPRAQFHWADALDWRTPEPVQTVIMNPPFHKTRSSEPALGVAFIEAAARLLKPGGTLYMVANAHLPYEYTIEQAFSKVELLARTTRFKVFKAERSRDRSR
ncbi:class I SAM-dependent methyltransferase [Planktotalea arctica]|uniref:class I SAM-dependent methyltransferase n=1 Tax=Planktotalea arctica TaxID=1481893 RepID=UPI00321B7A78